MAGSRLPEPVLYVALDAVEKIQGGEDSASALWSVFSRAKDAVKNGRRLENMSWRLWHCARVMPRRQLPPPFSAGLPSYPEMLLRPLSSPSHSFTSSSEGTAAGSDWDRDTAVGEDDEVLHPGLHGSGARRKPVVSPQLNNVHFKLSSGISNITTALTRSTPASAPSLHRIHHNRDDAAPFRQFPHSGHSDSAPHQPPQTDTDACPYVVHERVQGISYSDLRYHGASPTPVAGDDALSAPPLSQKIFPMRDLKSLPTYTARSPPSGSTHPVSPPQEIPPIVTSSSMPTVLPSLADSRKDTLSVGRFIADLLPQKELGSGNIGREAKLHIQGAFQSNGAQCRRPAPRADLPQIVEPLHPTPPLGRNTSTLLDNTLPSSTSPTPSAATTPRQIFPTVVVVNPTPHPTPPATPSPDVSESPYGLRPTTTPFDEHSDKKSDDWVGASNGQLATPVSLKNGDSHPLPPTGPTFLMDGPKNPSINGPVPQVLNADVTVLPLRTSLLPAAAIALPEQVNVTAASQLLTPSSNPHSEMSGSSSRATPSAPIPAPEDKKFFLAALHNSSGHESSESPDSLGGASISPQKPPQISKDVPPALQAARSCEDEVASSFSAGSSGGARPRSVASSRGGGQARHRSRAGFNIAGGTRRRQGPKKIVVAPRQASRMEKEFESKQTDNSVPQSQEEVRVRSKGKEKAVDEGCEVSKSRSIAAEQHVSPPKSQPKPPRSPALLLPQNLRHLPTNPPRQQAQASVSQAVPQATTVANTGPHQNSRQLPLYPPFSHLGLGHLPTVPPRPRRPIEITETSSEYETTDSDESSWESASVSGDDAGDGEGRSRSARVSSEQGSRTAGASTSTRTRGASEFQRDAEREKQRARELFQKLPPRSYSHVGQLPRTKSGLSQLFHPDPALFPDGHPYRTSHSSRDILARNWSAPGMPLAMTQVSRGGSVAGPMQAIVNVQSVGSASPRAAEGSNSQRAGGQRTKYMRKGPPQDQEQETDSGEDDPEDTIQVSSSVAQRRLAAIMGQQPAKTPRSQRHPTPLRTTSHPDVQSQASSSQQIVRTTTAPMLMHPYLPDPAPLQTPHTVRRNIISQELDEELRRNLLWERSQNQIQGRPARAPGSILPGPWRSLTPLRPEERDTQSSSDRGPGQRTFSTQRTKSWAGDYHAAGW